MKFRVICQKTSTGAHSPIHVVELSTGQGVGWINRFLDREYARRLSERDVRLDLGVQRRITHQIDAVAVAATLGEHAAWIDQRIEE